MRIHVSREEPEKKKKKKKKKKKNSSFLLLCRVHGQHEVKKQIDKCFCVAMRKRKKEKIAIVAIVGESRSC
jgi:hypothetical protein